MCAKREREKNNTVCGSVVVFAGGGVGLVAIALSHRWFKSCFMVGISHSIHHWLKVNASCRPNRTENQI